MLNSQKIYYAVVEDVNDPSYFGRVRIRVHGLHSDSLTELPTELLPWATVLMPITEPFISGIGWSPTGIVEGATVLVIPHDEFMQDWIVIGTSGGQIQKGTSGKGFTDPNGAYPRSTTNHDVNVLARGKNGATVDTITEGTSGDGTKPKGWGALASKVANRQTDKIEEKPEKPLDPTDTTPKDGDAKWMPLAVSLLGINEKDNPDKVKEFHKKGAGVNFNEDIAWCSSFANFCMKETGFKGTNSAMAKSWLTYGQEIPKDGKIPYGSIMIFQGTRGAGSGHVGFYAGEHLGKVSGKTVKLLAGNQTGKNAAGKKIDNGGAVTETNYPLSALLGIRWPKELKIPTK